MDNLFAFAFLISLIALFIGIISPKKVLPKSNHPTRKRVFTIYGSGVVIFFILFGITASPTTVEETVTKTPNEEVASDEPIVTGNEESKELTEPPIESTAVAVVDKTVDNNFLIGKVTNVVDGDTIDVIVKGKEERVRLILVDTPETRHPNKPVQPFGPEATEFTISQLNNKEVKLEMDVEERDRYGRLLAYIWVGEELHNKSLLEKGLARVAVYPPNTKYVDEFRIVQAEAQSKAIGIWSIENYATDKGFIDVKAEKADQTPPPPSPTTNTQPQSTNVSYKNCSEVRAAGAAPIRRGEPGYAKHLDRDGDGIGCE